MNNLSLDSHLVFIKDQIEWCDGAVIDRDENDNPICVRNYCNLDTAKYWLDMFIELEKDLGCPLEIVFKALKQGIYTEKIDNTLLISKDVSLKHNGNQFVFMVEHCYCVVIKNYKKTWWLSKTKEE